MIVQFKRETAKVSNQTEYSDGQSSLEKAQALVCAFHRDYQGNGSVQASRPTAVVDNNPVAYLMLASKGGEAISLKVQRGKPEQYWWFGTLSHLDYQLSSPCGSEFSFKVEYTHGMWFVSFPIYEQDAYVNNEPVQIALLDAGDEIMIKGLRLRFCL